MRDYSSVSGGRMVVPTRALAAEMAEKLKRSKLSLKPAECADRQGRLD